MNSDELLSFFQTLPKSVQSDTLGGLKAFAAFAAEYKGLEPAPEKSIEEKKYLETTAPMPKSQRAKFRDKIVRDIWSPELRSELVDRILLLVESKTATTREVGAAIKNAKAKSEAYDVWKPVASWCKQKFEDAGAEWAPCAPGLEPQPEAEANTARAASPEEVRRAEILKLDMIKKGQNPPNTLAEMLKVANANT